jgi:hypothetical protein
MPPPEVAERHDAAILWPVTGIGGDGQVIVSARQQLYPPWGGVRWEDKRTEVLKPDGSVVKFDVLAVVNLDIAVGSIMWKGRLAPTDPPPTSGLHEVVWANDVKDLKGRVARRIVGLMRWNNTLPTG